MPDLHTVALVVAALGWCHDSAEDRNELDQILGVTKCYSVHRWTISHANLFWIRNTVPDLSWTFKCLSHLSNQRGSAHIVLNWALNLRMSFGLGLGRHRVLWVYNNNPCPDCIHAPALCLISCSRPAVDIPSLSRLAGFLFLFLQTCAEHINSHPPKKDHCGA